MLLDRLAGSLHRWDHRGEVVRLRHRTWFLERPREIPLRIVRRWQESCERYGALTWEDVGGSRTALTDVQRESLLEGLIERLGLPWDFGGNGSGSAPLLYNALTPAQRGRLRQGRALPMAEMTPAQRTLFLGPLREAARYNLRSHLPPVAITDWTAAGLSLKSERLLRTREQHGAVIRYKDRPAASAGNTPAHGPVLTPQALQSGSSGRTASPAAVASVTPGARHYLVTRWRFSFQYSPVTRSTQEVTVASPP